MIDLSLVRRLEAVGFESFPAGSTYFHGTWAVRLTKNHSAKRLNSVNALDPGDTHALSVRLKTVKAKFDQYGKPLIFRKSPLMPQKLGHFFEEQGWREFDETCVMTRDLSDFDPDGLPAITPESDVVAWVDAAIELGEEHPDNRQRLIKILESMTMPTGLFLLRDDSGKPACVARCVVHGDMVGLFEMATREDLRGKGFAKRQVASVLQFGKMKGARHAWLQVVADNDVAMKLYKGAGFLERYRYSYWTPSHG